MKIKTIGLVGSFCFMFLFSVSPAAGGSSGSRSETAGPAAAPSRETDLVLGDVDQLLGNAAGLEAEFARRCVRSRSKLAAEFAERARNIDTEIGKELGKPPPLCLIDSPGIDSVACDKRIPYIEMAKALADIRVRDISNEGASRKYYCEAIGKVEDRAIEYYSCMAVARKDESACDPLKSVPVLQLPSDVGRIPLDVLCKNDSRGYLLSTALITRDPSADKICREICGKEGISAVLYDGQFPMGGDAHLCETICSLAVVYRNDPGRFCREALALPSLKGSPLAVKSCKDKSFSLQVGLGGPLPMARMVEMARAPDPSRRACTKGRYCFALPHALAYAAFRKAFAAGNKELCGDSGICRAMMGGGPEACRPYDEAVRDEICHRQEHAKKRNEWELAVKARRSQLESVITRFNAECAETLDQLKTLDEKIRAAIDQILPDTPGRDLMNRQLASMVRRHRQLRGAFASIEAPH